MYVLKGQRKRMPQDLCCFTLGGFLGGFLGGSVSTSLSFFISYTSVVYFTTQLILFTLAVVSPISCVAMRFFHIPLLFFFFCLVLFSEQLKSSSLANSSNSSNFLNPSLTIYNSNFALVRDSINLNLKQGYNKVFYDGATMSLEPTSVILDPVYLGGKNGSYPRIVVAEQSYRNDILSPSYMLSLFEGQNIDFLILAPDGSRSSVVGKIIRSGYQIGGVSSDPIIEVEGKLRFGLPGIALFPSLGEDTLLKPRLEWQIYSSEPFEGEAHISYLTSGLSWQASYNLVLSPSGDSADLADLADSADLADLAGWVSITNNSGRSFDSTLVELMAGEVNRVVDSGSRSRVMHGGAPMFAKAMDAPGEVTQKSFDEFHLYTLPSSVSLRDKEVKQVEFLSARNLMVKTIYRYVVGSQLYTGSGFYEDPDVTLRSPESVSVIRRIENSESNQLGIPLPAGTIRLYRQDGENLQFIGEDSLQHTPKNQVVEVVTGKAFDVRAKRIRTAFELGNVMYLGRRTMTESFEFTITNRKDQKVVVNIIEYLRGPNWVISAQSHEHRKTSASEVGWDIVVDADTEAKLTYTIEYKW